MNKRQIILSWTTIGVFVLSVCYAPWESSYPINAMGQVISHNLNGPLWNPPSAGTVTPKLTLRTDALLMEWAALALVYSAVFFLLKDKVSTRPLHPKSSELSR